jgi:hypothetical protein
MRLFGSDLHACTSRLWRGINVMYDGTLSANFNNGTRTFISDAEYAVTANNLSNIFLLTAAFDKNYVSLYVPPAVKFGFNTVFGSNNNNHFTRTGTLQGSYNGQVNLTGTYPYAGMELHDVAMNIDDDLYNGQATEFKNLNNGIIAINSSLMVKNTTFKNILAYNPAAYTMPMNGILGTGIFSGADPGKHGLLFEEGIAAGSPPPLTFENCVVGIHTNNISADISLNQMDEITFACIQSENARGCEINIHNNQLKSYFMGIRLMNNRSSTAFNVTSNEIGFGTLQTGNGFAQIGIMVDELSIGSAKDRQHPYNLFCNSITEDFLTGIQMSILPRFGQVNDNNVDMASQYMWRGLDFLGCESMLINSNTVEGTDVGKGTAFNFYLCNSPTVSDNRSNGTYYGFDFQGYNGDVKFRTNHLGDPDGTPPLHYAGLHLNGGGIMGLQYDQTTTPITVNNNQWSPSSFNSTSIYLSKNGAINENLSFFGIMASAFIVKDPSSNTSQGTAVYPWYETPQVSNTPWFSYDPTALIKTNGTPGDCSSFQIQDQEDELSYLDERTAMDSIENGAFETETKYMAASNLFDKLLVNETLRNSSELYADFFDLYENENIGKLSAIRLAISEACYDSASLANIMISDSIIISLMQQKAVLDTGLYSGLSTSDSLLCLETSQNILQEINSTTQEINAVYAANETDWLEKIEEAATLNAGITPDNVIEENETKMNALYLDKFIFGNNNLDSAQLATLDSIAPQCPFAGGHAVFIARAMKRMLGDSTIYNDSLACAQAQGLRKAKPETSIINSFIKIYPNPAYQSFQISYSLAENEEALFEINDLTGRILYSCKLYPGSNQKTIFTKNIPCGYYLYNFKPSDEKASNGKIAIIK